MSLTLIRCSLYFNLALSKNGRGYNHSHENCTFVYNRKAIMPTQIEPVSHQI